MEVPGRPLRVLVTLGLAVTAAVVVVSPQAASAANPRPTTIPALQRWTGGTGTLTLSSSMRIVSNTGDAGALATTSQTFADDLRSLSGYTISQTTGTAAQPGDVFLSLGSTDSAIGGQGYDLSITNGITIKAKTANGVFNGTRTLLQLLHQTAALPQGTASDWPVKPERGEMVDNGRKFFTLGWLENQVQELAYLKMNTFHLHLSDNLGFRIQSDTHPEAVSADHLTKADVRTLLAFAAKYHVTVFPEIDMPGHMDTLLAGENSTTPSHTAIDLRLKGADGSVNSGYLDVSNPASYSLVKDLINEYLPLFPDSPYFGIGADEYAPAGGYGNYPQLLNYARQHYGANANAKDAYLGFVNFADGLVRAGGKTTRMWNDGIGGGSAVTVNTDIKVDYWTNGTALSPQALVNAGYTVTNQTFEPTYYVLGSGRYKPDEPWAYETWTPDLFRGGTTISTPSENPGSLVHIWCDVPGAETEAQIADGVENIQRILAQQDWGSPKLATAYTDYQHVITTVGRNPAWRPASTGDLAVGRPTTASSVESGTSFSPALATDGNTRTRWSSARTDPQWLQVDLGATQPIRRVRLSWEAAYGKAYQIQASNDGTDWTTLYSTTTGTGGVVDIPGLNGSGRYVRMLGNARGTRWGYSLYEFEIYNS